MESPERGIPVAGIAMEFPVSDGGLSCSPPTWLRRRLLEPKTPPPSTVEEIEAKLREADLRRQVLFYRISLILPFCNFVLRGFLEYDHKSFLVCILIITKPIHVLNFFKFVF